MSDQRPRSSSALLDLMRTTIYPRRYPMGLIPVTHQLDLLVNAQNGIEKMSLGNRAELPNHTEEMDSKVKQLTKEQYVEIVQSKRRAFVHEHFGDVLAELFGKLEREANKMKNCHFEARFSLPEHFDVDKTEALLREYFRDIGFETIAEPRKDETTTIVLTLT